MTALYGNSHSFYRLLAGSEVSSSENHLHAMLYLDTLSVQACQGNCLEGTIMTREQSTIQRETELRPLRSPAVWSANSCFIPCS